MSEIKASVSSSELLGFTPRSIGEHFKEPSALNKESQKQGNAQQEANRQNGQRFSDADIDLLLKKSNIEVNQHHRLLARFFLRHHIVLDKNLFELTKNILPGTIPKGAQADAFIAALSKLPMEQIRLGFQIIQSTLQAGPATFSDHLFQIKGLLSDIVSETFNLKEFPMDADSFRKALNYELEALSQATETTQKQISSIVDRVAIAKRFTALIRFSQNFQAVLKGMPSDSYQNLEQLISKTLNSAKRALNILLSDSILSREDVSQKLHHQGACHSLGVSCQEMTQPGRLWVHDRDNPSSRELDPKHLKLFFRWSTEELGIVEAEVEVEEENFEITFASEHSDVVHSFNQESERLSERLESLGYKVDHKPTLSWLKFNQPERQIHKKAQEFMKHLDTEA